MMEQIDLFSSQMINSRKQIDLTLYFREMEIKKTKSVSCIEIFENSLYLGTKEFQVYAYDISYSEENLMIELTNERSFPAQCTTVEFIVASQKFLIVVPNKEQQLIRIWNRDTLQLVHGYYGHQKQISSAIFLKDKRHLASCGYDCTVRIWDISNSFEFDKEARKYEGIFPLLTLAELDENTVAFGGDDCLITVWDWRKDMIMHKCYAHLGSTTSLTVCFPNLLYSIGGDCKIKVWKYGQDQSTPKYLSKLQQFKKKINQNVFTIKISDYQILSVDSRGHIYLMNQNLEIGSSKLRIPYTETIRSIKLWKNRLFVVFVREGKGELKEIAADFEEIRHNAKGKEINPIQQIPQKQEIIFDLKIVWKKLTLTDPKTGFKILNHLDGYAESGNFITIMGPSGAGKSSLLSILACRLRDANSKLQIEGHFQINGENYGLTQFSKVATYVQQDDVLFGSLTVRETFIFHAKLKLWSLTPKEQLEKCESILKKLNLYDCADTLIGNSQFKKCISGGQKKRVAIGVELLSNPKILIFDEPTSGLDSHNALIITRLLNKLAKDEKKLILATTHQPSTLMFQEMDELYLLKGGECIYSGKANRIVHYMESLKIEVNYRMNPADFFMLEISTLKELEDYKTPLNHENSVKHMSYPLEYYELESERFKPLSHKQPENEVAPFCDQFQSLFDRSFKAFIRTPSNQLNKFVTTFLIPIFLGILYNNIGGQVPSTFDLMDQSFLFNFFCFIFMAQYFVFAMNVYETILVFPTEKQIVCKQARGNLYSILIYFFAKMSVEVFGCIIPAVISGVLIYFAGGLNLSFSHFGTYLVGIFVLLGLTGIFFGMMFGVLNKDPERTIALLPMVLIPIIIFGGLIVSINEMPEYVQWLPYLSPLRHSFLIIFQDQLNTPQFSTFSSYNLPEKYGLSGDPFVALGYLAGLLGLYLILSILLLIVVKRKY